MLPAQLLARTTCSVNVSRGYCCCNYWAPGGSPISGKRVAGGKLGCWVGQVLGRGQRAAPERPCCPLTLTALARPGYLPMSQVWTLSLREVRRLAWTTQPVRVLSPKTQVPRAPSGWINPKLVSAFCLTDGENGGPEGNGVLSGHPGTAAAGAGWAEAAKCEFPVGGVRVPHTGLRSLSPGNTESE